VSYCVTCRLQPVVHTDLKVVVVGQRGVFSSERGCQVCLRNEKVMIYVIKHQGINTIQQNVLSCSISNATKWGQSCHHCCVRTALGATPAE
jgi:hypothetical protein